MPMNSCVIVVRMLYQICTHEAVHSFENGVMTGTTRTFLITVTI